jgi:hypothetical protein
MIIKFFVFIGFFRVLITTDSPMLCSVFYAIALFLPGLAIGQPLPFVLIRTGAAFALASLYFWLLSRFEDSGLLWWIILIAGLWIVLI